MTGSDKIEVFRKELDCILDPAVKSLTELVLTKVDDKFFTAPAASSGKYHPKFAHGEGGLVRHTKAAVTLALELLSLRHYNFRPIEKDHAISALVLHDTCKSGVHWENNHTVHEHPILVEELISTYDIPHEQRLHWFAICYLIASHMGQWNINNNSDVKLPYPETPLQQFVHDCDYIVSRNFLHFTQFDEYAYSFSDSSVTKVTKENVNKILRIGEVFLLLRNKGLR